MGLLNFRKKTEQVDMPVAQAPAPALSQVPQPLSNTTQSPMMSTPSSNPFEVPASVNPFALPDLPPMPLKKSSDLDLPTSQAMPQKTSIQPVMEKTTAVTDVMESQMPDLPELPAFDNHPELDVVDQMFDEEKMHQLEAMAAPKVTPKIPTPKTQTVSQKPVSTSSELPSLSAESQESTVNLDKPLFIDVEQYADMLEDINTTKADLKHIHERSGLTEYEDKIDDAVVKFKDMIMNSKKELNNIDQLLFAR